MATLNDLAIRFGGLTVLAQMNPLGLPPTYSMQSIKDQVPKSSLTPDSYRDLFYPKGEVRSPSGSLMEALGYIQMLIPTIPWQSREALYIELEAKAWDNWTKVTGFHR